MVRPEFCSASVILLYVYDSAQRYKGVMPAMDVQLGREAAEKQFLECHSQPFVCSAERPDSYTPTRIRHIRHLHAHYLHTNAHQYGLQATALHHGGHIT